MASVERSVVGRIQPRAVLTRTGGTVPRRWQLGVLAAALCAGLAAGLDPVLGIALAAGGLFVAVVLSNLTAGLCLFGVVAFLEALPRISGAASVAKIAGALLALSWLATVATRRGARDLLFSRHPGLTWIAILFLGWTALSLLWAEDVGEATTALSRYALNLLLLPIIFTAIRKRQHVTWLLWVFVGGALVSAAYGAIFPSTDPFSTGGGRLSGAGLNPNFLASLSVVATVLGAALAANRELAPGLRVAAAAASGLCVLSVAATGSRGGLVSLAAVVVLGALYAGRGRRLPIVFAGATIAAVVVLYLGAFAPTEIRERVFVVEGGTGRTDIWTVGWRMVEDNPVLGVGAGNYKTASIHYLLEPGSLPRGEIIHEGKVAHNLYLHVLAELGVVGLALFGLILAFAIGCAMAAARRFKAMGDRSLEIAARGVVVATAGVLTADFFASGQFSKPLWMLLGLGPALLAIAQRSERRAPAEPALR